MSQELFEGYRLSPQQERLWQLRSSGDASAYRSHCAALIEGKIDSELLQAAVNRVIARHEILRTSLRSVGAMTVPVQVISETGCAVVQQIDLTGLSEQEQATELELLYEGEREPGDDSQCGSGLEVALARVGEDRQVMVVRTQCVWSDKKGLRNVIREVMREYQGKEWEVGESVEVEQGVQYADVSEIFNELMESEGTKAGREYWSKLGESGTGEMRLAGEKEKGGELRVKVELREVSEETRERVMKMSERERAGEGAVMLSVLGVLIRRLSGEREVRVGVSYDGRTFEGLREAIGLYARNIPIDINLDDDIAFVDLAKVVDESTRELYKWQNYFNWRQVLNSNTGDDKESYFPYLFEYEAEETKYSSGAISYSIVKPYACIDRFKVKLSCHRSGEELTAEFHYDSNLYDQADISRLADQYMRLLQSAAQDPRGSISRLEILSPAQREMIVNEFNQTRREYDTTRCVHELIEEQAERSPGAVAVVYEQKQMSYGELNARANQLANYLRGRGVGPEQVVGVMVSRSMDMVVGLLAVMKAGAAYLPLDADYPKQRLAYMLQDARVKLLLTEQQYGDHLPDHNATVIYLDSDWEVISQESVANPASQVDSRNLVYVIYTSGTTGNPKGAMLTHAGIVNCFYWMQETYKLDATDRFLMKTSLNFDPSVWELFWPLWAGGAVVLAEPQRHQDSAYLIRLIAEREVTSAYFVPSMLRAFLDEPGLEACQSLRRVICGGESLSIETVNHFFDKLHAEFHHSYGPTETSIAATEWTCQRESKHLIVPIGKPLGNTQVYILDAMMQPAPVGVPGELYIGGMCVGRGYLNRADLTAERFVPDSFSIEPGARFYKTGDLACYLPDGDIEFLGRVDNQVKIRGLRVELGEIEAALAQHAGVNQAVVMAREDRPGEKYLVAYVTLRPERDTSVGELRDFIKGKLPACMEPSSWVTLEEMPLTPSGKVDINTLRSLDPNSSRLERSFVAPRNPIEEVIAGIWADVLHLDEVSIHDNFFEMGGHSLLATQLISRVRQVFQTEVSLRLIFESPTVAGLGQSISSAIKSGRRPEAPPIVATTRGSRLPLSFAQQRLWFLDQLEPNKPFYNVPAAIRMTGKLDIAALGRTLSRVVSRHEVLRTSFSVEEGEPVQVIGKAEEVRLPVIDLSQLKQQQQEAEAGRVAGEEARKPFDLSRGPMLRASVMRLADEEHIVMMSMHHIVSDGWSVGVLVKEVGELYEGYVKGEEVEMEELEIQYGDYAVWQRGWMKGEVLEEEVKYWRKQLGGEIEVMEMGRRGTRREVQGSRGGREVRVVSREVRDKVKEMSRREGVTMFMWLLAAFKVMLHKYTGLDDIVVGTPIAGRNRREIEGLIGFFINTLALRTNLGGDPTFRELLGRVREVALGAYAHQDLPFEKLIEILKPERQLSQTPIFQVVFALQNTPAQGLQLHGLRLSELPLDYKSTHFDLTFLALDTEEGLMISIEYRTDLFEAAAITRMLRQYDTLLTGIVKNPGARLDELEITSEAEKMELEMEKAKRRDLNIKKLRTVKRAAVELSQAGLTDESAYYSMSVVKLTESVESERSEK